MSLYLQVKNREYIQFYFIKPKSYFKYSSFRPIHGLSPSFLPYLFHPLPSLPPPCPAPSLPRPSLSRPLTVLLFSSYPVLPLSLSLFLHISLLLSISHSSISTLLCTISIPHPSSFIHIPFLLLIYSSFLTFFFSLSRTLHLNLFFCKSLKLVSI